MYFEVQLHYYSCSRSYVVPIHRIHVLLDLNSTRIQFNSDTKFSRMLHYHAQSDHGSYDGVLGAFADSVNTTVVQHDVDVHVFVHL